MTEAIKLDGHSLSRAGVIAVARHNAPVVLCEEALAKVRVAANLIKDLVDKGNVVYGVTTGFGSLADKLLDSQEQAERLQRNLIVTHAVGVGRPLSIEMVRALMVIRINTLLQGHSGIQESTLQTLVDMLNKGVHPYIPEKGSVGASGDLAPLSHMALVVIGEGKAYYQDEEKPMSGRKALKCAGIKPVVLTYKEGLALNNGTTMMLAYGVLVLDDMERLIKMADISAAMTAEGLAARSDAFIREVHDLRPHPGQRATAANMRQLLKGSTLVNIPYECVPRTDGSWTWNPEMERVEGGKAVKPQDSYSVRCVPQVHGAVKDAYIHVCKIMDIELNTVTDNPIVFPEMERVVSAGNFHGMPIALAMTYLKATLPTLASISERRLNKLVDHAISDGLPAFLIKNEDNTDSGFMIVQYTAAALVNDLATRAMPATVYSVPTSANTEDHVSMGATEGRHIKEMVEDVYNVIAMEMYTATQAVDLREQTLAGTYWNNNDAWLEGMSEEWRAKIEPHMKKVREEKHRPSPVMSEARKVIRKHIDFMEHDRSMAEDVEIAQRLIRENHLINAVEKAMGEFHFDDSRIDG